MSAANFPTAGVDRRIFLRQSALGTIGMLALEQLLRAAELPEGARTDFQPRANRVICLFQSGGPSQMDLFDPKPELNRLDGQVYAGAEKIESIMNIQNGKLMGTPFKFQPQGKCGMELSEILPHTATIADDITLVRSMVASSFCHEASIREWVGGSTLIGGRPSVGSWVQYGLGSLNDNLPAYVVLPDPQKAPVWGAGHWTNGWLPASYQGTPILCGGDTPVVNLQPPARVSAAARTAQLAYLNRVNLRHHELFPENTELSARIANFEMAARMQTTVPEIVDLSHETAETRALYGLDHPATKDYGLRVLMARRLVEAGVRFVSIYLPGQPWDTHAENATTTQKVAAGIDQPSAALVKDLKQRGLLDSTIVLWLGEFGRTPISEGAKGRDHSRAGFSMWIAGGGFKGGHVHGATDEIGHKSVQDPMRFCDLHATLLRALGIDHTRLTYQHQGREESLTDHEVTKARVFEELFA